MASAALSSAAAAAVLVMDPLARSTLARTSTGALSPSSSSSRISEQSVVVPATTVGSTANNVGWSFGAPGSSHASFSPSAAAAATTSNARRRVISPSDTTPSVDDLLSRLPDVLFHFEGDQADGEELTPFKAVYGSSPPAHFSMDDDGHAAGSHGSHGGRNGGSGGRGGRGGGGGGGNSPHQGGNRSRMSSPGGGGGGAGGGGSSYGSSPKTRFGSAPGPGASFGGRAASPTMMAASPPTMDRRGRISAGEGSSPGGGGGGGGSSYSTSPGGGGGSFGTSPGGKYQPPNRRSSDCGAGGLPFGSLPMSLGSPSMSPNQLPPRNSRGSNGNNNNGHNGNKNGNHNGNGHAKPVKKNPAPGFNGAGFRSVREIYVTKVHEFLCARVIEGGPWVKLSGKNGVATCCEKPLTIPENYTQFFKDYHLMFELSPDGRYVAAKLPGEEDGACIPPPPVDSHSTSMSSSPATGGTQSSSMGSDVDEGERELPYGSGGLPFSLGRSGRSPKPGGVIHGGLGRSPSPGAVSNSSHSSGDTISGSSGGGGVGGGGGFGARSDKLCMYLLRPGGCRAGNACRFSHNSIIGNNGIVAPLAPDAAPEAAAAAAASGSPVALNINVNVGNSSVGGASGKPPKSPSMKMAKKVGGAADREEFALLNVGAAPA